MIFFPSKKPTQRQLPQAVECSKAPKHAKSPNDEEIPSTGRTSIFNIGITWTYRANFDNG